MNDEKMESLLLQFVEAHDKGADATRQVEYDIIKHGYEELLSSCNMEILKPKDGDGLLELSGKVSHLLTLYMIKSGDLEAENERLSKDLEIYKERLEDICMEQCLGGSE